MTNGWQCAERVRLPLDELPSKLRKLTQTSLGALSIRLEHPIPIHPFRDSIIELPSPVPYYGKFVTRSLGFVRMFHAVGALFSAMGALVTAIPDPLTADQFIKAKTRIAELEKAVHDLSSQVGRRPSKENAEPPEPPPPRRLRSKAWFQNSDNPRNRLF